MSTTLELEPRAYKESFNMPIKVIDNNILKKTDHELLVSNNEMLTDLNKKFEKYFATQDSIRKDIKKIEAKLNEFE